MSETQRLRQHPHERFAAPVQHVDLPAAIEALRKEPHHPVAGHRQIALFKRGSATLLVFDFEANGFLKEHHADGTVIIQTIAGHLQITAGGKKHELPVGQILALEPNVKHSVAVATPSTMLLTVCRGLEAGDGSPPKPAA